MNVYRFMNETESIGILSWNNHHHRSKSNIDGERNTNIGDEVERLQYFVVIVGTKDGSNTRHGPCELVKMDAESFLNGTHKGVERRYEGH
jgi:hypothetical protein